MQESGRSFEDIYDIYAIRVIVDTITDCYSALGEIHDIFRPLDRFKDYISRPKSNMYQSLHTTVIEAGIPFEVQIRTKDMHQTAELGIAAHWKYKAGIAGHDSLEDKIAWIRQILDNQQDSVDSREIVGSIKTDLAIDEVYVFTPKGDVISLPPGSTVIDFAYAIHTQVGHRMIGAKVDGRMVSLDTVVESGNMIHVLTSNSRGQGPSRDWLNIAKNSSTRTKIRAWFKRERRDENIAKGKADVEHEFGRYNILLPQEELPRFLARVAKSQHLNNVDDFYAAIGYGGIQLSKSMTNIKELYQRLYKTTAEEEIRKQLEKSAAQRPKKASSGVIVEGLAGCLVKFAQCCNPLPGDDIIGYITRGYGVSVHQGDCINVESAQYDVNQRERWVKCEWAQNIGSEKFKTTIDIYSKDRQGLLLEVSIALNNLHLQVHSLNAKDQPDEQIIIQIVFSASGVDQLKHVIAMLTRIPGVSKVVRTVQ
jgi:GTP pyrophosphokinase